MRLPHLDTLSISDELEKLSNTAKAARESLIIGICALTKLLPTCQLGVSSQHAHSNATSSERLHTSHASAIGINERQTNPQIHWSHSEACSSTTRSRRATESKQQQGDIPGPQSFQGCHTRGQKEGLQEEIQFRLLELDAHHLRCSNCSGPRSVLVQQRCDNFMILFKYNNSDITT